MSKITSILALGPKHTEGQRADFVCPLVLKGSQPSDSMASRHLIATGCFRREPVGSTASGQDDDGIDCRTKVSTARSWLMVAAK